MKLLPLGRFFFGLFAATLLSSSASIGATMPNSVQANGLAKLLIKAHVHGGIPTTFKCPPSYGGCLSLTAATPVTAEYCFSSSGNCSSGLTGTWYWGANITPLDSSAKAKKLQGYWTPDPSNPSIVTLSTTSRTARATKVIASALLFACSPSNGCITIAFIGITN